MRITFILPTVGMSGGIRVIAVYAKMLLARGHQVVLISPPPKRLPFRRKLKQLLSGKPWPRYNFSPRSHLDGSDLDHRVLEQWRPVTDADVPDADVVIATWWETAHWVKRLSESKGAKAYFVQDYGAHAGQPLDRVAETWRLGLHMFTISDWLRQLMRENGVLEDIAVILNSVDFNQFDAPARDKQKFPTVGFLHDLRTQKGTPSILAALQHVRKKIPDLRVVAFGPDLPSPPFPRGSEFFHFAKEEDLPKIYSKCDVWVFASSLEGFGLPIIEAMACRTPVVATPAGAAPMLLAPGGGRLVNHNDAEGMATAIVELLSLDNVQWRNMSQKAYNTIRQYTWKDATEKFESELRTAISKKSGFLL